MIEEVFNSSNIAPKFELLNDPEHILPFSEFEERYQDDHGRLPVHHYREPLKRVRALRDFGDVKMGDIGGYLQNADFLDHNGHCWIYDDACVVAPWIISSIDGSPLTRKPTFLFGNAQLRDRAIFERGWIGGDVIVRGSPLCDGTEFSGRTLLRRRRVPYFLTGEIHDNLPNGAAMECLYNADLKQHEDSHFHNRNLWRAFWDQMHLGETVSRINKRKNSGFHHRCIRW